MLYYNQIHVSEGIDIDKAMIRVNIEFVILVTFLI